MAVLPDLIRRLLWATAFPRKLEFRAEAGVRASGFDGVLETHLEGAYWPAGTSIWELSVRADPGTKANKDYKTRTEEVPAEARAQLTYVAVGVGPANRSGSKRSARRGSGPTFARSTPTISPGGLPRPPQ
jgi:hypothetical protein